MIKISYSRKIAEGNQRKFKRVILRLKITYFFYGGLNGGYLEGNALSYFNVLTAINLHYISVTMKQKHCELVLQVCLQKLQCSVIKPNYVRAM